MENSKEQKRHTIQSFFSSCTTKSQQSNNSLISHEITACQLEQSVQIDSTFLTGQEQPTSSLSSKSPRLLSASSSK